MRVRGRRLHTHPVDLIQWVLTAQLALMKQMGLQDAAIPENLTYQFLKAPKTRSLASPSAKRSSELACRSALLSFAFLSNFWLVTLSASRSNGKMEKAVDLCPGP